MQNRLASAKPFDGMSRVLEKKMSLCVAFVYVLTSCKLAYVYVRFVPVYRLSNVTVADEKFTLFHQY